MLDWSVGNTRRHNNEISRARAQTPACNGEMVEQRSLSSPHFAPHPPQAHMHLTLCKKDSKRTSLADNRLCQQEITSGSAHEGLTGVLKGHVVDVQFSNRSHSDEQTPQVQDSSPTKCFYILLLSLALSEACYCSQALTGSEPKHNTAQRSDPSVYQYRYCFVRVCSLSASGLHRGEYTPRLAYHVKQHGDRGNSP